jgi:hypothetical protein
MAQTKRKRRSKHRGTAAGTIEARGRTGRKPKTDEKRSSAAARRQTRFERPPTWRGATNRALLAAGIFFGAVLFLFKQPLPAAISLSLFTLAIYIPLGYYTDLFLYRRRMKQKANS